MGVLLASKEDLMRNEARLHQHLLDVEVSDCEPEALIPSPEDSPEFSPFFLVHLEGRCSQVGQLGWKGWWRTPKRGMETGRGSRITRMPVPHPADRERAMESSPCKKCSGLLGPHRRPWALVSAGQPRGRKP